MFRVCTAEEMRKSDRDCMEIAGIPGIVLMENAARGCVDELVKRFGTLSGKKAACFCGKGNNGGDGLAIARLLSRRGAEVTVFLTHGDFYSGDAAINREILTHMDVETVDGTDEIEYFLPSFDFVVDGIFGTGISGEIDSETSDVIDKINRFSKFILSVDIPSGVNADTGRICGNCIKADVTVTFAGYKMGQFLFPGCDFTGDVVAPMAGISNTSYRKIIKEMGCGLIFAEMVSDKAIMFGNEKTIGLLKMDERYEKMYDDDESAEEEGEAV